MRSFDLRSKAREIGTAGGIRISRRRCTLGRRRNKLAALRLFNRLDRGNHSLLLFRLARPRSQQILRFRDWLYRRGARELESRYLLAPGQRDEEVVVVRAAA